MKKLIAYAFLLALPFNSYTQSLKELWKQRDVGFGITLHKYNGYTLTDTTSYFTNNPNNAPDTNVIVTTSSLGFTVFNGWNFPLISLGDNMSVGIDPNIAFTVNLAGGMGIFIDLPIFATLKYGADANWNQSTNFDKDFGFTLGIGYQPTLGYTEAPITMGIDVGYALPTVMAEVSYQVSDKKLFKLRLFSNLGKTKYFDPDPGFPVQISYSQWGFSFIITRY